MTTDEMHKLIDAARKKMGWVKMRTASDDVAFIAGMRAAAEISKKESVWDVSYYRITYAADHLEKQ